MLVTLDQAREAKEELKDVYARHSGFVLQIGLVTLKTNHEDHGIILQLSRYPDPIEKMQFPEIYTTKSKIDVPVYYMINDTRVLKL